MYRKIMYNELDDAKIVYENGFMNKEYNFHESVLVSKYVRHVLGYGDARTNTFLKEFCKNNDKFFVEVPNLRNIKTAVARSRRPFVNKSNPISICQSEIDAIKTVEGYKQKKILFSILVLSKINNGYLYNNEWNKIRRTLHSKITNKNISGLMQLYNSLGLLYGTQKSYHKLLFVATEESPVFTVSPEEINNLKLVFEKIFGKDLFECIDCHKSHERKSYNQKRCSECSELHKKEKWRIQKIRQRSKMSTN